MKTIKIMIAASKEMHEEKLEFSNLIEHLNEVLEPRGVELKRIKWNPETDGSIDEFKSKLKECEMCLTLYWRDLAGNSEQELNTAYQELKDGNNPRNLYVFFKEPTEDLTEALKDFKTNFVTNYGHFFCKFENVDTMNLHFILQFEAYQNSVQDQQNKLINVKGGKVIIEGKEFVNIDNVPFAAFNKEYQRLQKELAEIDTQVIEVRTRHKAAPDNEDIEDELMAIKSKRKELAREFEKYQVHLYDVALIFAKTASEKYSDRMQKAREFFEKGNVIAADEILNMQEMKLEAENEKKQFEQYRHNLELKINEFLLKSDIVMANTLLSIPDRYAEACEAYEQAIEIANTINYDDDKMCMIFFGYANLLMNFNNYERALLYYDKIIVILEKSEVDISVKIAVFPAVYNAIASIKRIEKKRDNAVEVYISALKLTRKFKTDDNDFLNDYEAILLHNIGGTYFELAKYEEAERYFTEAIGVLQKMDKSKSIVTQTAIILYDLAHLYSNIGKSNLAEHNLKESLWLFKQLASLYPDHIYKSHIASCLSILALQHIEEGDFDQAEEELNFSLSNYRELNDLERINKLNVCTTSILCSDESDWKYAALLAATLKNLADLHKRTNKYDKAEREYDESLNIYILIQREKIRDYSNTVKEILAELISVNKILQHNDLVIKNSKYFFIICNEMPDTDQNRNMSLGWVSKVMADVYLQNEEYEMTEKYYKCAFYYYDISDLETNRKQTIKAEILYNLAFTHINMAQYNMAKKEYNVCYNLLCELSLLGKEPIYEMAARTQFNLYLIYERDKDIDNMRKSIYNALEIFEYLDRQYPSKYDNDLEYIKQIANRIQEWKSEE